MKAIRNLTALMEEAREREQAGNLDIAAALYQRIVDKDPANRDAVRRLLMVYRRLKEYRKELAVVDAAMNAVARRDKATRESWLAAHPEAAKLGKAMLKSLGGAQEAAYGTDSFVQQLLKRKQLVERKISGVKGKRARKEQPAAPADKSVAVKKKEQAVELRRQAAERKKRQVEARRAAKQVAAEQPSLFVIFLRYLVSLEKIDAVMEKHVAFLDKYFASGEFLVSGRQVPRTGGIIIARGRDRAAVERITKQDPFIKGRLASVDIVEFKASKKGKGVQGWMKR
ncbi:MAG TPA: YciI family protein [Puia sp.]|jgi:uncharacterized protein YciI